MSEQLQKTPVSIEAEQAVLGGLMLDNRMWPEVAGRVSEEDFFRSDHRVIWAGISGLSQAGKPCDFVTLAEILRGLGRLEDAGGVAYLGTLANDTPSAANVAHYADIVREKSALRGLIALSHRISKAAFSPFGATASEILAEANAALGAVMEHNAPTSDDTVLLTDAIGRAYRQMDEAVTARASGRSIGIPTGLPALDRYVGGFQPGELVAVAARTSVGKTAMMNGIGLHAAAHGYRGLVVTLEESVEGLAQRSIAARTGSNIGRMRLGFIPSSSLFRRVEQAGLDALPIWINTRTDRLSDIVALATQFRHKHSIDWLQVDHVGLVKASSRERRNEQIAEITRTLKQLAQKLGIVVMAAVQLNRDAVREDGDVHHLADSDSIGRDANVVIILSRKSDPEPDQPVRVKIKIAKSRYGMTGTLPQEFLFFGAEQRFSESADT